jgi:NADPH-dependent curcumin reductase CurA
MLDKQLMVQGFLTSQFEVDYTEMLESLALLHLEGRLHLREVLVEGAENAPLALEQLLAGEFAGKVLVRIAA